MEIHDEARLVEIWLTNGDQGDAAVQEAIGQMGQAYRAQNYRVAVFRSGTAPLYDQTRDLLLYNRRRQAEQEAANP